MVQVKWPRCPPCPNMTKAFKIFFFGTRNPIILKLGMGHQGLKVFKVYINDDPGLTLTYCMARSICPLLGENCEKKSLKKKKKAYEQNNKSFLHMGFSTP